MRINTNVGALDAARNLFLVQRDVESSMGKLSSGLRINHASDDAAGLAIANKLRTSTRALTVAANNAEQANAMLQIAEGSATQIQRILERQKELYIQRASSQNNGQTASLDSEYSTLSDEAARIVNSTNFQGADVFGASLSFKVSDTTASGASTIDISIALSASDVSAGTSAATDVSSLLDTVNTALGTIGAAQNRLGYAIANIKAAIVNQSAAESTIRDVDMASEMAMFTKNNILAQAGTAMLAQANQSGQSVLSLLR
ncbi:MAG: flagellin [Gemmatimonadaceae bacterium]